MEAASVAMDEDSLLREAEEPAVSPDQCLLHQVPGTALPTSFLFKYLSYNLSSGQLTIINSVAGRVPERPGGCVRAAAAGEGCGGGGAGRARQHRAPPGGDARQAGVRPAPPRTRRAS